MVRTKDFGLNQKFRGGPNVFGWTKSLRADQMFTTDPMECAVKYMEMVASSCMRLHCSGDDRNVVRISSIKLSI